MVLCWPEYGKDSMIVKDDKTEMLRQIVMRRIVHTPVDEIAKEFNTSRAALYRLFGTQKYRDALKELSEESTGAAVMAWRASMSELIKEAHRALKEKLADNDLKAVEIVLKSIGVDNVEATTQSSSITVVLPGEVGKTIEVENG